MRSKGFMVIALAIGAAACTETNAETEVTPEPLVCDSGLEAFEGRCVDPSARYEPDARIDEDNVVAYGDPISVLDLPEPPKSGFRIIVPPRLLEPGEEDLTCVSWPFPELHNKVIYAARMYATAGLHHSNVLAKPINTDDGPNPYPACHPGAGNAFNNIPQGVPDVLFANSTQIVGEEKIVFPVGMGYPVDTTREIVTDIHFLNASTEARLAEIVYDFYTMPDDKLVTELAPFVMSINDFSIPPMTKKTIEATCKVFGGEVFTLMPHAHHYLSSFGVDFVSFEGEKTEMLRNGAFDATSTIVQYDPPLDLTEVDKIRFACDFDNTSDHEVHYGIGDNEMCILFGYLAPVRSQFASYVDDAAKPCTSIQIGVLH